MGEIICNSINGIDLNLKIDERITVIGGLSGSGKTYLINEIKNIIKNPNSHTINVDISRFTVIDDELNISNVIGINDNTIVFVDRYDSFAKTSRIKIWEKMQTTKAIWVIVTRNPDFPKGLCCSTKSFKELKYISDKKHIQLYFVDEQ